VTEIVPVSLQDTVEKAAAAQPVSPLALAVGVTGLLLAGTGVVSSAYQTLNHVAAVPYRLRAGFVSRWLRFVVVLVVVLSGALAVGALTVVVTVVPAFSAVPRVAVVTGSYSIAFTVLLLAGRLLLDRPAPLKGLWPAAAAGAVAVTLTLQLGAIVLPGLIRRAGPVYGSFATVAGLFTLLYAVSLALVYAAEMAVVRRARLWPRRRPRVAHRGRPPRPRTAGPGTGAPAGRADPAPPRAASDVTPAAALVIRRAGSPFTGRCGMIAGGRAPASIDIILTGRRP
jgi:uncharacterized BrkB/YihY/UPF0761 family membrane protein